MRRAALLRRRRAMRAGVCAHPAALGQCSLSARGQKVASLRRALFNPSALCCSCRPASACSCQQLLRDGAAQGVWQRGPARSCALARRRAWSVIRAYLAVHARGLHWRRCCASTLELPAASCVTSRALKQGATAPACLALRGHAACLERCLARRFLLLWGPSNAVLGQRGAGGRGVITGRHVCRGGVRGKRGGAGDRRSAV